MKIVILNDENKIFFKGLDPYLLLDRYEGLDMAGIGIAFSSEEAGAYNGEDYGESDFDVAAGLMIISLKGDDPVLMWLYVDPEFRNRGVGTALIDTAFRMASGTGYEKLYCCLTEEYARNQICEGEEEYLAEQGFKKVRKKRSIEVNALDRLFAADVNDHFAENPDIESIWNETIEESYERLFEVQKRDLEKEESAADNVQEEKARTADRTNYIFKLGRFTDSEVLGKASLPENIISIATLAPGQFQDGIKKCIQVHDDYVYENPLKHSLGWYDLEISSCEFKDGKVTGLFLIHPEKDGSLWPEYLFNTEGKSPANLVGMISYSVEKAGAKYPDDTKIVISAKAKIMHEVFKLIGIGDN